MLLNHDNGEKFEQVKFSTEVHHDWLWFCFNVSSLRWKKNQILSWNRNPQLSEMKPSWNCFKFCISANNCHNNYSFLKVKWEENLYIVIVIFLHLCFNVAETIKGGKLFKWGNYSQKYCTSKIISLTALYL